MGVTSKIEWCDATWNPWQGCTKISPACEHCYMFTDLKRYGRDGSVVVRSKPPTFNLPLKRKQGAGGAVCKEPEFAIAPGSKVFTCSWSDWFHEKADPWRPEAWEIIRRRRDVIFLIVTKRIDRAAQCLPEDWGDGYPNVWIIVTAESQEWLDKRIEYLVDLPAIVRGLSIEPLLGPIRLGSNLPRERMLRWCRPMTQFIDWVIVGGESGPGARPMHPQWVRSLRDECNGRVPFFFKQWGDWCPWDEASHFERASHAAHWICQDGSVLPILEPTQQIVDRHKATQFLRIGKAKAGRVLDAVDWSQFPDPYEVPF